VATPAGEKRPAFLPFPAVRAAPVRPIISIYASETIYDGARRCLLSEGSCVFQI
jgi:hypothetical protein